MTETNGGDDTGGPTDQERRDLIDGAQHRRLIEERRRDRARRHRTEEAVSLLEVLGALGAHQVAVAIRTTAGDLPDSLVCEVGRDYVALRSGSGPTHLVPVSQITAVRPVASERPLEGDVVPTATSPSLDLSERLRELLAVRADLRVTAAGSPSAGRLCRVGADVLVIEHVDGSDEFVALAAVDDVAVAP